MLTARTTGLLSTADPKPKPEGPRRNAMLHASDKAGLAIQATDRRIPGPNKSPAIHKKSSKITRKEVRDRISDLISNI